MKLQFLTTSFPRFPGDPAGQFILHLARSLQQEGVQVEVIAPDDPQALPNGILGSVPVKRFSYMLPRSLQTLAYGGGILPNLERRPGVLFQTAPFLASFFFAAMRSAGNKDLLHCFWAPSVLIGLAIARLHRKPIIVSVLGSDVNAFPEGSWGRKTISRLLRSADFVITQGEDLCQKVLRLGVPAAKVRSIPLGPDLEKFPLLSKTAARGRLRLPSDKKILLSVGRLVPSKGLLDLMRAAKILQERRHDWLCVVVGEGPQKKKLEEHIRRDTLEDYVRPVGFVDDSLLPLYFRAADIFVMTSHSEGLPTAMLQAMACENAVVSSAVGAIPEVVREEITGLLVPPGDPAAIADRLHFLLCHPEKISALGKEARRFVLERFSPKKTASQVIDVYRSLLER